MPALRCFICGTNWPPLRRYETCPSCEEPTRGVRDEDPISYEEADSLRKHAEFERFYERRGEEDARKLAAYDPASIGDDVERELNK